MKADIRRDTPTGSNFQNSSPSDILDLVLGCGGAWKDKAAMTIATNPIATNSQLLAKDLL